MSFNSFFSSNTEGTINLVTELGKSNDNRGTSLIFCKKGTVNKIMTYMEMNKIMT